jgi:uncharacterized membrane protein YjgN (DUF898 family)
MDQQTSLSQNPPRQAYQWHDFSQTSRFDTFAPVAVKNGLLSIITLTLYRFWGRTEMRRRFWADTSVMGDAFEYSGTGWELFRGFLIAAPVLFGPYFLVFFVLPTLIPIEIFAMIAIAFIPVFFFVLNLGVYLQRRYQLSRTRWRGIRFGLGGSAFAYAAMSLFYTVLEIITLGWFHPVARMRRAKMLWRHARFGDQPFAFAKEDRALARGLWGPFAVGWFGVLIGGFIVNILVGIGMALVLGQLGAFGAIMLLPGLTIAGLIVQVVSGIAGALVFFAAFAGFNAQAMRRTAELLDLDGARFVSNASGQDYYAAQSRGLLTAVFSLGLLAPVWGMWMMRMAFGAMSIEGTPRLDEIFQGRAGPRDGEGVADAFDLDFGAGLL